MLQSVKSLFLKITNPIAFVTAIIGVEKIKSIVFVVVCVRDGNGILL